MPRWELRAAKAAIVIASSVLVMSAAIEIEAWRDALCTTVFSMEVPGEEMISDGKYSHLTRLVILKSQI